MILGGGFAGVYAAMHLERRMSAGERERHEIALVSLENYMVFQPLLPEVVSGTLETLHAISPIRRLARRTALYTREVQAIDLERRVVTLAPEMRPRTTELAFDHLVIALGTRLAHELVPGLREHAMSFRYLGDALRLRNALVQALEEADNETDAGERRRLLTFVVAGGGFSGVECVAELHDFLECALPAYRTLRKEELRTVLVQSAARILPELGEDLAGYAHRFLARRGVEIRLETRLQAVTARGVVVRRKAGGDEELIASRIVVTTVPTAPHRLVERLPFAKDATGRIAVTPELSVPGHPHVWALGDCAAVPQADGITSPPTAQHAVRQARTCAANVLATLRGRPLARFAYTGPGRLASLGHRSAVAEVFGLKLRGVVAWAVWRAVYLAKFPGFDRKLRIFTDWFWDLFLPRDITEVRIFRDDAVAREHFHAGEPVFFQGDFGDKVYAVVRGEAEVVHDGGGAVARLGPGEVFGEMALIGNTPRTATVRAASPLDVVSISRGAFCELVEHLPGVRATMDEVLRRHR